MKDDEGKTSVTRIIFLALIAYAMWQGDKAHDLHGWSAAVSMFTNYVGLAMALKLGDKGADLVKKRISKDGTTPR